MCCTRWGALAGGERPVPAMAAVGAGAGMTRAAARRPKCALAPRQGHPLTLGCVARAAQVLLEGAVFLKYGKRGDPRYKRVHCDTSGKDMRLCWSDIAEGSPPSGSIK
jgi:hypothetical protein